MGEKVQSVRVRELECVQRALLLKSFNLLTLFLWPVVVSMVTFVVFVLLGNQLTVTRSITILGFVNVLSRPITVLPMALISVAEVRVSVARIEKFLTQDELQRVERRDDEGQGGSGGGGGGGHGNEDGGEGDSTALVHALPKSPRRGHKVGPESPVGSSGRARGFGVELAGVSRGVSTCTSGDPARMRRSRQGRSVVGDRYRRALQCATAIIIILPTKGRGLSLLTVAAGR